MEIQDTYNVGTNLCPIVKYTVPGDYTGKQYTFDELPIDRLGRKQMGCKIVNAQPCVRCGKCGRQPSALPGYYLSVGRLPGLVY